VEGHIRALVVDDESLSRRGLMIRLREAPDIEVVGEAVNGREALLAIREHQPDLVFLDIEMPGMSGFDVISQLPTESMPLVVFVTAFDRYAIQAFEARAVDYLLKPVDEERMADRLMHLMADLKGSADWPAELMEAAGDAAGGASLTPVLPIRHGAEIVRVPFPDIDWIDAAGDYMCVHAAGETYILRGTMKSLEDVLDPAIFQRVHRSTIVNLGRVERLRPHINGEFFLMLAGGHEIKLSRTYRDKMEHFLRAGRLS
jgi:two-component system LytT family response regulator